MERRQKEGAAKGETHVGFSQSFLVSCSALSEQQQEAMHPKGIERMSQPRSPAPGRFEMRL